MWCDHVNWVGWRKANWKLWLCILSGPRRVSSLKVGNFHARAQSFYCTQQKFKPPRYCHMICIAKTKPTSEKGRLTSSTFLITTTHSNFAVSVLGGYVYHEVYVRNKDKETYLCLIFSIIWCKILGPLYKCQCLLQYQIIPATLEMPKKKKKSKHKHKETKPN